MFPRQSKQLHGLCEKIKGEIMNLLRREFQQVHVLLNDIPAWVLSMFTAGCIAMNLLANKSMDLNIDWIVADCGILVSWVSFFSMDIIVKRYGAKASIIVSIVALLMNLIFAFLFKIAASVQGAWGESFTVANPEIINTALNNTFAGTSYILFGSAVAFIVSVIVNSTLNEAIGKLSKKDNFITFALRSYVSTFIGQFVDNFTFALLVSINFFGWTIPQSIACACLGAVLELGMEAIFSPIGYRIVKKWDRDNVGQVYRKKYTNLEAIA